MRFLSIVNYVASYALIAVAVSATTTIEYSVVKNSTSLAVAASGPVCACPCCFGECFFYGSSSSDTKRDVLASANSAVGGKLYCCTLD